MLLTVCTNTYFKSQLDLATALTADGGLAPVFYFPREYPELRAHVEQASRLGFETHTRPQFLQTPNSEGFLVSKTLLTRIRHLLVRVGRRVKRNVSFQIASSSVDFVRVLRRTSPTVIVLPAEGRYEQNLLARLSQLWSIRVVVAPAWVEGPNELLKSGQYRLVRGLGLSITRMVNPRLIERDSLGRTVSRYGVAEAFVRRMLGILPSHPWELHSGFAREVAVESQAHADFLTGQGIGGDRVTVTGSVSLDRIWFARQREQGPTTQRLPRVLFAIPPDMSDSRPVPLPYVQMLRFVDQVVSANIKCTFVATLHPTTRVEEIPVSLRDKWEISTGSTEELIAGADAYIASISATIAWALAAGLPVVNWDYYDYGYRQFERSSSVLHCGSPDSFVEAVQSLNRLLTNQENCPANPGLGETGYWGLLDGQRGKAIAQYISREQIGTAEP